MDSHAIYVGMSRHRKGAELFWSKEEFTDRQELVQVLGRDRSKDVTLDYSQKEKQKELKEPTIFERGAEKEEEALDNLKSFAERFEREHPELAREAREEVKTSILLQDLREERQKHMFEAERKQRQQAFETKQREVVTRGVKAQEERTPSMSTQERKMEKLISNYHALQDRYNKLEEQRGARSSMFETRKQIESCAQEIFRDNKAMAYLQKNDKNLFQEMSKKREQEKVLARQDKVAPIFKTTNCLN